MITFRHPCDDKKVESIIDKIGFDGYYFYFRTIEYFAITKNTPIIMDDEESLKPLLHYLFYNDSKNLILIYKEIQSITGIFEQIIFDKGLLKIKEIKAKKEPRHIEDAIKGKIKVAEYVYLTTDQIKDFTSKYGVEFYNRCVEVLNDYKANKGGVSRYNDDAAAIRNWVIDRTMKEARFANYKYPFNSTPVNGVQVPKFKRPDASELKNY